MTKDKKRLIFIISIILVCSIAVAASVYAIITNASFFKKEEEASINLEENFEKIFNNETLSNSYEKEQIDKLICLGYDINHAENGKYDLIIKLPKILIEKENAKNINEDINETFLNEALNIIDNATTYTKFDTQYAAYINDDILSIIIKCNVKSGGNPQRKIIKTYCYNIKEDKILTFDNLINEKGLNKKKIQEKIKSTIEEKAENDKSINDIGYNIYIRDSNSDMYNVENTTEFYIDDAGNIYAIYAYGNDNYTTKLDVISVN